MPYRLWKDGDDDSVLLWWAESRTLTREVSQFPWLHKPSQAIKASNAPDGRVANPAYSGDLCFTCQHINFEWLTRYHLRKYNHDLHVDGIVISLSHGIVIQHMTIGDAEQGRETGCPYCSLLLQAFTNAYDGSALPHFGFTPRFDASSKWSSWLNSFTFLDTKSPIWITYRPTYGDHLSLKLSVRTKTELIPLEIEHQKPFVLNPSCEFEVWGENPTDRQEKVFHLVPGGANGCADLSLICSLLKQCQLNGKGHELGKSKSVPWPTETACQETYFLDIERGCIHLGNTKDIDYVALSYVWGNTQIIDLTMKTLPEFQSPGFFWAHPDIIPRTIADAMLACRLLGSRYLWVDRFCIVQDHPAKQSLINNMHLIYSSASITIVAAAGMDATSGLPGVRRGSRKHHQISASPTSGINLAVGITSGNAIFAKSVWNTRAWTLQEKFCSRRLLVFGEEQYHFRCPHCWCDEEDVINSMSSTTLRHAYSRMDDRSDGIKRYIDITTDYTKRSISYDYDIFNAYVGSLVKVTQSLPNPVCITAIPVAFLDVVLLFKLDSGASRRSFLEQSQRLALPSWSWLGWKGNFSLLLEDRWTQFPLFTWIPPADILPLVDDIFLVRPDTTISPTQMSDPELLEHFKRARYGNQTPAFQNIFLTELHLIADVASFRVGNEDMTESNRYQLLDAEGIACGIVHLHDRRPSPDARYRCVKIAVGQTLSVDLRVTGQTTRRLSIYDESKYTSSNLAFNGIQEYGVFKVLVINDKNERIGIGSIHVDAFDVFGEKDVSVILH